MKEPAPIRGLLLPFPWNLAYDRGTEYILTYCVAMLTEEDLQISVSHAKKKNNRKGKRARLQLMQSVLESSKPADETSTQAENLPTTSGGGHDLKDPSGIRVPKRL